MPKNCFFCKHCIIDQKALLLGLYINKCRKKDKVILHPFWSGWGCKDWGKEDG